MQIFHLQPASPLQLDEDVFAKNIRSSRRGVAGGPSGMTFDHLRPMLDNAFAMLAPPFSVGWAVRLASFQEE